MFWTYPYMVMNDWMNVVWLNFKNRDYLKKKSVAYIDLPLLSKNKTEQ